MENEILTQENQDTEALDELKYLSALRGKSALDTVREYVAFDEKIAENELKERFADDEFAFNSALNEEKARRLEIKKNAYSDYSAYEKKEAQKKEDLADRLSQEFNELSKEFPQLNSFSELPKEVLQEALDGQTLFNAYLRYLHRENKRLLKQKETELKNTSANAGSMQSSQESFDSVLSAFIKGLHS